MVKKRSDQRKHPNGWRRWHNFLFVLRARTRWDMRNTCHLRHPRHPEGTQ